MLVVAEAEIASTHLLMQVMKALSPFDVSARLRLGRDWAAARRLDAGVTPLFARCADPTMLPFAEALVEHRRPYLYYLDDDLWSLDPATPLGAYYGHPSVRASLDFFVTNAALVLTNTTSLADRLQARGARVAVVPTFFRFDLISNVIPEETEEIRIGFAGSVARTADLDLVVEAVTTVLSEDSRTVFEFIGALPNGVVCDDRLRFFPSIADYETFIALQASRNWSIGLAPLLATPSNLSKTDNKFREYAACGIAGLYSDVGPYPAAVTNGVDGLLVTDVGWTEALRALLRDPERLRSMRLAARDNARARYDIEAAARAWESVINGAIDAFPASHHQPMSLAGVHRRLALAPFLGTAARVQAAYRTGGVRMVAEKTANWVRRRVGGSSQP